MVIYFWVSLFIIEVVLLNEIFFYVVLERIVALFCYSQYKQHFLVDEHFPHVSQDLIHD